MKALDRSRDVEPVDERAPPVVPFEAPGPGSWAYDAEHCERPHSRYIAALLAEPYTAGMRAGMERYGGLLETIDCRVINGFTYVCPRPLGAPPDARRAPPKLIFRLLTWLHPALRRRIGRAAEVIATKPWRAEVTRFFEQTLPAAIERFERIQALDLEGMDDETLVAHLDDSLASVRAQLCEHFTHSTAAIVPVGDFLHHTMTWTGCSMEEAIALLDGHSPYSLEVMRELDAAVEAIRADEQARATLEREAGAAQILDALVQHAGPVGACTRRWLERVGQRVFTGHDVAELRGIEVPELLVGSLRTQLSRPPREIDRARVEAAAQALRARVPEAQRAFFDELLGEARLVHPLRDGHSVIDFWAFGLMRRSLLEAGRRLHARGALRAPDHAVDLEHGELVALLRGEEGPSADRVAHYVQQRRSLTTEDAPDRLGPPPAPPPPPEWLPPPARRIAEAMHVYIGALWAPERGARPRKVVSGVAASAGTYTGRARVVRDPGDFVRVERGDVLIARITTAAYNVLLPLLGAVVTDRGGLLSHPAIVAREYGIPGVVGCRDATLRIPDGARVEVDGTAGTVKVLS